MLSCFMDNTVNAVCAEPIHHQMKDAEKGMQC